MAAKNERELFKMKKFDINFKLVLTSQIISLIGGNILRFALILFILDLSGSVGTFGLVMAITQLPVFLFAIPGGIIADRMDKKKLIVFFDGIKTVLCLGLVVIFLTGTYTVANLTAVIALFMVILTLFSPILVTATPAIVKEEVLVEANGAIQSVNAVSELLSFVLGGVLIATIGMINIVILAGVSFLISTGIDMFIKIAHEKQAADHGIVRTAVLDMKDSFTYATKKNPFIIKVAVFLGCFAFLIMPIISVAMPYIVRVQFEASDTMFGVAQAVSAFGMLLGGILTGVLKKWLNFKFFPQLVTITAALCLLLAVTVHPPFFAGLALPFWLFNIVLMLVMVIMTFGNIIAMSFIQERVPEKYLGKTIALLLTILNVAIPTSQFAFGWLMEIFVGNLPLLFVAVAVLMIGLVFVAKKLFVEKKEAMTFKGSVAKAS